MPRRPAHSGYERLEQADHDNDNDEAEEEEEEDADENDEQPRRHAKTLSRHGSHFAPIQPARSAPMDTRSSGQSSPRARMRRRRNSGIDIKAINARLERWADEIAAKFKRRGRRGALEQLEIHHSVFQPPEGMAPATSEMLAGGLSDPRRERITKIQFDDVVESVRVAIELGVHPKMNTRGSSGSYFARNSEGKVVGVFKPKDEEPYATKNPKWTKWIHRNLFPCFFGRACLIPNLSYVSEAAAYVLDSRLQTDIVPYTDVVRLASISFNYDFWDRRAYYRKHKAVPAKVGSFQVFLKGFEDANMFLKVHPWPDRNRSRFRSLSSRPVSASASNNDAHADTNDDDGSESKRGSSRGRRSRSRHSHEFWTDELQQSFREELEKLVILDYIMRNTDRGLDNWMIKIDTTTQKAKVVAEPPKDLANLSTGLGEENDEDEVPAREAMLGAIDNSLSWPWKHPDAWRTFPFGWLFLPVSLIGQPFSEKTRQHFLPLLTSKKWWVDTRAALRECFRQDSDFQERMFARQMAVMKGQAWNVVETLKTPEHGPLELTRCTRVCVWDDVVDVPTVTPMRTPSPEMHHRPPWQERDSIERESVEVDIGVAGSKSPDYGDMILSTHSLDEARGTRFNLSRQNSSDNLQRGVLTPDAVLSQSAIGFEGLDDYDPMNERPGMLRSRTRVSYDASARSRRDRRRRKLSLSSVFGGNRADDDGDLGYAAAGERDLQRKRVVVERLETVKTSIPVFTWC